MEEYVIYKVTVGSISMSKRSNFISVILNEAAVAV